jgi:hypothetical protein
MRGKKRAAATPLQCLKVLLGVLPDPPLAVARSRPGHHIGALQSQGERGLMRRGSDIPD